MLWEKESDGAYIDLLQNLEYFLNVSRINRKKSNLHSLRVREEGNKKFKENDFEGAMAKYNESVCLAENGSEYLGLAYGNRSSCFLKLKMYNRCLADIQLAKDSHYPEHLMPKLDQRKIKCMQLVQSEMYSPNYPTLSFEADENLPCMANVLQIMKNEEYGRFITAKEDIQIGQTVLIEEAYVRMVYGDENKCANCAKHKMNFIPCENCADAMFCTNRCRKNNFHDVECDILFDKNFASEEDLALLILRSVIIGIASFTSIDEMMEFIENCRSTDPNEISQSVSSSKSAYRTFFKLSSVVSHLQISNFRKTAYFLYHSIMNSSNLAVKFQTKATQRFLPHLIIHHGCILRKNVFGGFSKVPMTRIGESVDPAHNESDYEQHLSLLTSYFNHSCMPNITKLRKDNLSVCKAILPIKKGDQLFINYINDDEKYKTKQARNDHLQDIYGFTCNCRICSTGILKNTYVSQDDPAFKFVVNNLPTLEENFDIGLTREIIENCIQFLSKYQHMIPSGESLFITTNLAALLQLELQDS